MISLSGDFFQGSLPSGFPAKRPAAFVGEFPLSLGNGLIYGLSAKFIDANLPMEHRYLPLQTDIWVIMPLAIPCGL